MSKAKTIFQAAFQRMTLTDQRDILAASEYAWQQQLNGNAGSQDRASRMLDEVITTGFDRMLASDRAYVEGLAETVAEVAENA